MDKKPKISVCVPCYNATKYLDIIFACLEAQTFDDFDVVIVDDGSKDDTYKLIQERMKISKLDVKLFTQPNKGLAQTRNEMIKHATGEYIFFMDADDSMTPRALEKLYAASDNGQIDIIAGKVRFIFNEKFKFSFIPHSAFKKNMTTDHFVKSNLATVWGILYRRCLFKDIEFLSGYIFEDIGLMTYVVLKNQSFTLIKDIVYNYNRRFGNKTLSSFNYGNRWSLVDLERQITYIFDKYNAENWLNRKDKLRAINGTLFPNLLANIWLSNSYSNSAPINMLPIYSLLWMFSCYGMHLKFSKTPWKFASFLYINSFYVYKRARYILMARNVAAERDKLFKNLEIVKDPDTIHNHYFSWNNLYLLDFKISDSDFEYLYNKNKCTFLLDISEDRKAKYEDRDHILYGINMHDQVNFKNIPERIYYINMSEITYLTTSDIEKILKINKRILIILNKKFIDDTRLNIFFNIIFR